MYINPQNEYPRYVGDIMLENPSWEEGQALPTGWVEVSATERPAFSSTQKVVEVFPTEVDGNWVQTWEVVNLNEEELEQKNAPTTVKEKLTNLGFNESEIRLLLKAVF